MPASLTPQSRFAGRTTAPPAPRITTLGIADSLGDLQIPLPPPTIGAPWPPRRGGMPFELPNLDHTASAALAGDASDRTEPEPPDNQPLSQDFAAGYDAGMRDAIVSRSWWDIVAGLTWGAALIALLIGALAVAGWVDVKVRVWGGDTAVTPEPVQLHPTTHWSAQA